VVDLLLREDYGQMPVLKKMAKYQELEEFNTTSIDMGDVSNHSLPDEYYDINKFKFSDAYMDFMSYILGKPHFLKFDYDFPVVIPED
jgi:hypothetical protein